MTPRRRRLFFTFATLIASILQIIIKRTRISIIPKGKKAEILYGIKHHGLAILSFLDDHIMVIEYLIETVFPSSTRVFDKLDDLLKAAESFPSMLDGFVDHDVVTFLQRVPFLDRVFKRDEKEIVIDITCHGYKPEPENSFEYENVVKPDSKTKSFNVVKPDLENEKSGKDDVMDGSETVSDASLKEDTEDMNKETENMEDANAEFLYSARATSSADEILQPDDQDPIIDLFEAGWHMSPRTLSSVSSG